MTRPRDIPRTLGRDLVSLASGLRIRRSFAAAARGKGPIVAGPWHSEIGFELLYWIPMLRWFCEAYEVERDRLVALSRGGAEPWYRDIAGAYVDILDLRSLTELREMSERTAREARHQKQTRVTATDAKLTTEVAARIGVARANTLHPSTMYRLFNWYWSRLRPAQLVEAHTQHAPLTVSDELAERIRDQLPTRYVALKAYSSSCFPDGEANRAFLAQLIGELSRTTDVVLLDTGIELDDHHDLAAEGSVISARQLLEPHNNLAVQTAIISNADALFSTYGGFSYLAPYLGVPSVCFYSRQNFQPEHLDSMRRAGAALRSQGAGAPFLALHVDEIERLRHLARTVGSLAAT